jgi:hypothetical protein
MWFICPCRKYHFSGINLGYIQANMIHKEVINYEIALKSMADKRLITDFASGHSNQLQKIND